MTRREAELILFATEILSEITKMVTFAAEHMQKYEIDSTAVLIMVQDFAHRLEELSDEHIN